MEPDKITYDIASTVILITANNKSNYQVLRRASAAICHVHRQDRDYLVEAKPLPPLTENVKWLSDSLTAYQEHRDSSARNLVILRQMQRALQEGGTSLGVDLALCKAVNAAVVTETTPTHVILKHSVVEQLAYDIFDMPRQQPGQKIFVAATTSLRTEDRARVLDAAGGEWAIISDDSFQTVSLVPGAEPAVVAKSGLNGSQDILPDRSNEMQTLIALVKTRLLVLTDPITLSEEHLDWHSYRILGLLLTDIKRLAHVIQPCVFDFLNTQGRVVLRIDASGTTCRYSTEFLHHGFVAPALHALTGCYPHNMGMRFAASAAALRVMDSSRVLAAWNVLMVVRTVLEAANCGNPGAREGLKHSRTVNDHICEYDEGDVAALKEVMSVSEVEEQLLLNKIVQVDGESIYLEHVCARNEEGFDHESIGALGIGALGIGALGRPKLLGRRNIGGCSVKGGRGIPVFSADAFISYRSRGRRYRLSTANGRISFSNRSDLLEDLNIFRNVKRVEASLEGGAVEKVDKALDEGAIDNQVINALLHGNQGSRVATWIWALILLGVIYVDSVSTQLSYVFGKDVKVDDENGYKIRALLTPECLTKAVAYTDKKRLWVDVMDNTELREVQRENSTPVVRIAKEATPLETMDLDQLLECSITSQLRVGKLQLETGAIAALTEDDV